MHLQPLLNDVSAQETSLLNGHSKKADLDAGFPTAWFKDVGRSNQTCVRFGALFLIANQAIQIISRRDNDWTPRFTKVVADEPRISTHSTIKALIALGAASRHK